MSNKIGVCNQERGILTIIYCIFCGVIISYCLYLIGTFIHHIVDVSKTAESKRQKQSNLVFSSKISLFLSIIFSMIIHCIFVGKLCSSDRSSIYNTMSTWVYVLQSFLMLITWFIRLYSAFQGTILQIHRCTMFIFLSIAISLFVFGTIWGFDRDWIHPILSTGNAWLIAVGIMAAIFVSLLLFCCGMFIYKLIMVYRNLGSDEEFIKLITKITILNFTSILVTITLFVPSLVAYGWSVYWEFIHHFVILINYFSNFLCILLSYTYYGDSYNRYCGWMNKRCNSCWFNCIADKTKLRKVRSGTIGSKSKSMSTPTIQSDSEPVDIISNKNRLNISGTQQTHDQSTTTPTPTPMNNQSCEIQSYDHAEEQEEKEHSTERKSYEDDDNDNSEINITSFHLYTESTQL